MSSGGKIIFKLIIRINISLFHGAPKITAWSTYHLNKHQVLSAEIGLLYIVIECTKSEWHLLQLCSAKPVQLYIRDPELSLI